MRFARREKCDTFGELDWSPSITFETCPTETLSARDRASRDAMRDGRDTMRDGGIGATVRAAALAALLLGTLAVGLGAGMTWSAVQSAPDGGVMDFTY
jgi:hypothetical protein